MRKLDCELDVIRGPFCTLSLYFYCSISINAKTYQFGCFRIATGKCVTYHQSHKLFVSSLNIIL